MNEWTGDQAAHDQMTAAIRAEADRIEAADDGLARIFAGVAHGCLHHRELVVRLRRNGWLRCAWCGHRVITDGRRPFQTRSRPWTVPAELIGRYRAKRPELWPVRP